MADENTTDSNPFKENDSEKPAPREGVKDNDMIKHLKKISRDFQYIKTNMRTLKRNQEAIQKQLKKEKFCKRPKTPNVLKQNLPKLTLPGSGVDECIHAECIRVHIKTLVRDIDLSDGFLIDDMIGSGLLTVFEKNEIEEMSKVDKTRKLATIVGRNNKRKFEKFLQIISQQDYYPHIGKLLSESYEMMLREKEKRIECIRCFIVQKVNVKQIMDHLCEKHFIDLNDVDKIMEGRKEDIDQFWEQSFQKITDPVWGETCLAIFKAALQDDYPHIAKKILTQQSLKCICSSTLLSYKSGSVGSVSEISTTSSASPEPKPETDEWVHKHSHMYMEYQDHHSTQTWEPRFRHKLTRDNFTQTWEPRFKHKLIRDQLSDKDNEKEGVVRVRKRRNMSRVNAVEIQYERFRRAERERNLNPENKHKSSKDNISRSPSPLHAFRMGSRKDSNISKYPSKRSRLSEEEDESTEDREFKSPSRFIATELFLQNVEYNTFGLKRCYFSPKPKA